jgi:hypothetical protein
MRPDGKLLAWIETNGTGEVIANFVGKAAPESTPHGPQHRPPAKRLFLSLDTARTWVEAQGATIGIPVEWTTSAPDHCD